MSSFIGDFFENRGWLRIVQQSTTGSFQVGGVDIPAAIPLTFSAIQALDHTQYGTLFFLCTDKHSVGTTGGSLWQNDAVGNRVVLRSDPILVADLSTAISTYPPATYPGLKLYLTNWKFPVVSDGTRYLPIGGVGQIPPQVFGTLVSPTAAISSGTTYSFNTLLGTPTFPANMFAAGHILEVETCARRDGANATMAHKVTLGTAGTNSDASVWSGTLAATDALCVNTRSKVRFGSTTAFITNSSASFSGTGGVSQLVAGTANVDTTSALILSVNGSKNAADTINLFDFTVIWRTP